MRCLLALLVFVMLLQLALCRPKKASKVEKTKEKSKHKSGAKKSNQLSPEVGKTQKGTKKQMLGGLPGGEESQLEGLGGAQFGGGGAQFGGGGLGGEIEGMPTGMGAGAEPLGFGPMGAQALAPLSAAIPGIANPQAEDSRFEDGPRGTPIGLLGMNGGGPQNGEEQLEGTSDQAPIAGGLPNGEGPTEGGYEQAPFGRLGPGVDDTDKLNVEGPSLASFAPGIGGGIGGGGGGGEYNNDDSNPLNSLPSGNMVSPVINGPVEDGIAGQQGLSGLANSDLQDNQLVAGAEQQEAGQDIGQEAASIAKSSYNENAEVGAAIKEIDKVTDAKEAMHQQSIPEGQAMNLENANANAIQSIASAESAELRQTANKTPAQGESSSQQLGSRSPKLVPNAATFRNAPDATPAAVRDVEATSMTGGQVMMGVQGGMKRHSLKKSKTAKKSSKTSKKHTS